MMNLELKQAMMQQIGAINVLSISGGRVNEISPVTLEFPVSQGYKVRVIYDRAGDCYTVQRVMTRGTKEFMKGQVTRVYADQVGDMAYYASCYRNDADTKGEWNYFG